MKPVPITKATNIYVFPLGFFYGVSKSACGGASMVIKLSGRHLFHCWIHLPLGYRSH